MTEQVDHDLHAVNRAAREVVEAAQEWREANDGIPTRPNSTFSYAWVDAAQVRLYRALDAYEEAVGRARRSQEAG